MARTQHARTAGVRGELPAEAEVLRTLVALKNSAKRGMTTHSGNEDTDERSKSAGTPSAGSTSVTPWKQEAFVFGTSKKEDGGIVKKEETESLSERLSKKNQSYRGVTWDKVKQMWRVRLCLAGGGREHIGYFANEEEGAWAYRRALQRLKKDSQPGPAIQLDSPCFQQQQPATSESQLSPSWGLLPPQILKIHKGIPVHRVDNNGAFSHVLTDNAHLPGSPSASTLFHAHVNPSQVLNVQAHAVNLGMGAVNFQVTLAASPGRLLSVLPEHFLHLPPR